jgi:hypothetical protein
MVESRVERISFTPKREVLILGTPSKFTLRDKPECSILRPQRLMSNSPCRGFVWITRMMFGDQIHLEAPVGHADSYDLKAISEAIMMQNGFHTLSDVAGVEIDCEYSGECPECSTLSRGETFNWALSILGPGIITK